MREDIDSISLDDIDDCNEWLIGRVDEENGGDDELVMGEDGLTWDVSRDVGAGEPSHAFKSSKCQSNPSSTKGSNTRAMLFDDEDEEEIKEEDFDVEEEEIEEEDFEVEEEEGDGFKEVESEHEFEEEEGDDEDDEE